MIIIKIVTIVNDESNKHSYNHTTDTDGNITKSTYTVITMAMIIYDHN